MPQRWLIAGLGNPGSQYAKTRHNAGFWLLDALDRQAPLELRSDRKFHGQVGRLRLAGLDVFCLKPETFMNDSGRSVRAVCDYFDVPVGRVVVAYDDLDLPPGTVRLKRGGGHGGHNGLRSLFAHLGGPGFWRIRIGIGHPGTREAVTPWVLSRAGLEDETAIMDSIERAIAVLPDLLQERPERAMQSLHSAGSDQKQKGE